MTLVRIVPVRYYQGLDFFPESSLQETSIDLQSALTLFLSRINKVESNTAKVTKTNNLQEIITAQELDKVLGV